MKTETTTVVSKAMTKVLFLIDGMYFYSLDEFYKDHHPLIKRQMRVRGLQDYAMVRLRELGYGADGMELVGTHLLRGVFPTSRVAPWDLDGFLHKERVRARELVDAGAVLHEYPVQVSPKGKVTEKCVDVALAVLAMEAFLSKEATLLVLLAGDGDYVPLVNRLASRFYPTVLIGADIYHKLPGRRKPRTHFTSKALVAESEHFLSLSDDLSRDPGLSDPLLRNLFIA
jgi:uncharacterized LabA/DUF88 family protein